MDQVTRRRALLAAAGITVLVGGSLLATVCSDSDNEPDIHIGKPPAPTTTPAPAPSIPGPELGRPPPPEPGSSPDLAGPDGSPVGGPVGLRTGIPVPSDLKFILVVGSDARAGQDPRRAHGDSIHLLAVNPRTLQGTIVGFPRDAWVQIPGRGTRKITDALALGGPNLMAATVRNLTGLPVHYYIVTGFKGFQAMVDDLGGVNLFVERRMRDRNSGARFERGWHRMGGGKALAYNRNRHDVPQGDFSRSENQGRFMLAALAKMRAEVGDDAGLFAYVYQLRQHTIFDVPASELMPLAALARRLVPEDIRNVVVPGRVGTAGRASVVYLNQSAAATIFNDLRPDAVLGGAGPEKGTTTSSSSTSSSTSSTSTSTTSSTVVTPTTPPSGVTTTSLVQPSVTTTTSP